MTSLAKLSLALGTRQAAVEINWMRQAAASHHALRLMVHRRAQGEPLQYIIGSQPFGPLNILTRPPTLIPRPETEQWTTELAARICGQSTQRALRVLDICTGSGCIPLLLCHLLRVSEPTRITALGVDVSPSACQLAHDNISSCGLPPGCTLDIQQKSIFDEDFWQFVEQAFEDTKVCCEPGGDTGWLDVVTANPPYIPGDQWEQLPSEVKNWEDPLALLGDPDPFPWNCGMPASLQHNGLTFYERIRVLLSHTGILSRKSIVAMEVGEGQAGEVVKMFANGFGKAEVWKDWWGKERVVFIYGYEWS